MNPLEDATPPTPKEEIEVCFTCLGSGIYLDFDDEAMPCSSCGGTGLDS